MTVIVHIPTPLRSFTEGHATISVPPGTVGQVFEQIRGTYQKLSPHIFQEDGRLRSFVNVFVNDQDIRALDHTETRVKEGDEISIIPSIAGGATEVKPAELPELSHGEILRYSRHLILPEVGPQGQRRLKAGRVLLIGAGGLGSPASLYLAAAGVGTIGLVDFDAVDQTNLQRQIVHGSSTVGVSKLDSAEARLLDLNPHIEIETFETRLTSDNALDIMRGFDVVVDGTDNFPTRYLVNDACVLLRIPYVYGSIFRFEGQASVFAHEGGPCYRCLFREPPPPGLVPSCAEGGVLGVLPGIIGSIQALEAMKLLLNRGDTLVGRLLLFDALKLRFRELKLRRDPECPLCGEHPTVRELIDYEAFCGVGEPSASHADVEITSREVAEALHDRDDVVLVDVREPFEWEICHIESSRLMPLGELPDRLNELDGHQTIVTLCHRGARSLRALEILKAAGFSKVHSMRGGIDAWAAEVDATMARY